jgi:hypothetical protein
MTPLSPVTLIEVDSSSSVAFVHSLCRLFGFVFSERCKVLSSHFFVLFNSF